MKVQVDTAICFFLLVTGVFKYPKMHHLLESVVLMVRRTMKTLSDKKYK